MTVISSRNEVQLSDKPFAKGGEGSIYDVVGNPELVAKIYHPAGRTRSRYEKIMAMLKYPPKTAAKSQTAWPVDILCDKSGYFIGFLMPRIKKVTKIDILYSYDNRSRHPWEWYIQVAQNLCAAVYSVHQSGHCIGDLNPANICVEESTALVTLVDTDSYHICAPGGQTYPCVVCMPTYVPAELHRLMNIGGFDLRSTKLSTFTQQTDLFALAIHIFALLMNGCHPYACTVPEGVSASQFSLIKNMEKGYFPFVKSADMVGVPKYAPYLTILPQRLKELIIQTFTKGCINPSLRPDCTQWHEALEELENQLATCSVNSRHQYMQKESSCPWCQIERSMNSTVQSSIVKSSPAAKPGPSHITAPTPQTTRYAPSGRQRSFWTSGLGTAVRYMLTLIIWSAFNVLAQWGLAVLLPTNVWWVGLIRFALVGVIPFLPTWLFYWWGESSLPLADFANRVCDILIVCGRWLALIVYGGVALVFYWESGVINTLFGAFFVCLPILIVMKLFPSFTGE
ncbi:MAG: hypothetical protein GX115_10285 [Ruminiclostridium sp.]|nr:hypothetical protein [Ruminiclostridium sp.]